MPATRKPTAETTAHAPTAQKRTRAPSSGRTKNAGQVRLRCRWLHAPTKTKKIPTAAHRKV